MKSITIYPKDEKQKTLLTSLLEEMKVRFEVENAEDKVEFTEDEFYAKINRAIKEAEQGELTTVKSKEELNSYLESL